MQANPPSRFIKAILTGIAVTIITGLVLSPVVFVVFASLFKLYVFSTPPPGAWINDAIILITFFGALLIAAGVGGWACTGASGRGHAYSHALFLSVLWLFITASLAVYHELDDMAGFIAAVLTGPTGFFVGCALRLRKIRRTDESSGDKHYGGSLTHQQ